MTQQERIELLNRELKELADLLAGMKECQVIPAVFLNMARDKALRMAEGFEKLAHEKTTEPQPEVSACVRPVTESVSVADIVAEKPVAPEKSVAPEKPVEPEAPKRVDPMPVKEAFSPVYKEFTHTPVTSAPASDLRSKMTLNDRFLFQRELFRGDIGMLNFTLDEVNKLSTLEEALAFLDLQYHWDEDATGVKEFYELLERHFKGTII